MVTKDTTKKKLNIPAEKTTNFKHPDSVTIFCGKKVILSGKFEKTYTITVKYIQQTVENAKMKRSIVQNIMKKGYLKKGP